MAGCWSRCSFWGFCPFQWQEEGFHFQRTNTVYPSGSSPLDSSFCQNTDSSGAEPSIKGDLLSWCLSSASTEVIFLSNLYPIFLVTLNAYGVSLPPPCPPRTVYNAFTAEVERQVYHRIPQLQTADVWTRRGSHRTVSRWPNRRESALSPPATWETHYGQMKLETWQTPFCSIYIAFCNGRRIGKICSLCCRDINYEKSQYPTWRGGEEAYRVLNSRKAFDLNLHMELCQFVRTSPPYWN